MVPQGDARRVEADSAELLIRRRPRADLVRIELASSPEEASRHVLRRARQHPADPPTQHRASDGSLYAEELFGVEGFTGRSSLLYHVTPPTRTHKIEPAVAEIRLEEADDGYHTTTR